MRQTDGLEDQLQQILNDPQSMAQIMSLAQSLGMSSQGEQQEKASVPPPDFPDEGFVQAIFRLMQQARSSDSKQEALLCALKPYLSPDRREKMDRAMQIARISHLAGVALGQYGGLKGLGGR